MERGSFQALPTGFAWTDESNHSDTVFLASSPSLRDQGHLPRGLCEWVLLSLRCYPSVCLGKKLPSPLSIRPRLHCGETLVWNPYSTARRRGTSPERNIHRSGMSWVSAESLQNLPKCPVCLGLFARAVSAKFSVEFASGCRRAHWKASYRTAVSGLGVVGVI